MEKKKNSIKNYTFIRLGIVKATILLFFFYFHEGVKAFKDSLNLKEKIFFFLKLEKNVI